MSGKKRLYTEREKVRQTTHWDMDYLPREAVRAYYLKAGSAETGRAPGKMSRRCQSRLGFGMIAAGLSLLGAAIAAGRYFSG